VRFIPPTLCSDLGDAGRLTNPRCVAETTVQLLEHGLDALVAVAGHGFAAFAHMELRLLTVELEYAVRRKRTP
jgi:hypothetical protein